MKLIHSTSKQKVLLSFGNTRVIWEKAYYTTQSIYKKGKNEEYFKNR